MPEIIHKNKQPIKIDFEVVFPEEEDMPEDVVETPVVLPVIVEPVMGNFPALAILLQDELSGYLNRQKEAVDKVLTATREKTEFLEALAEKAKRDLESEKHVITNAMGNL